MEGFVPGEIRLDVDVGVVVEVVDAVVGVVVAKYDFLKEEKKLIIDLQVRRLGFSKFNVPASR